jgi:hypothetical protein
MEAFQGQSATASGESCRCSGHHLAAVIDPQRPPASNLGCKYQKCNVFKPRLSALMSASRMTRPNCSYCTPTKAPNDPAAHSKPRALGRRRPIPLRSLAYPHAELLSLFLHKIHEGFRRRHIQCRVHH